MDQIPARAKYFPSDTTVGVVLLHAYTGSPNDVNTLGRKLQRSGYSCLLPTFTGHATDQVWDVVKGTPADFVNDTNNAIEWMVERYDHVFVFGLSMGGIFATHAIVESRWPLAGGGVFNTPILMSQKLSIRSTFDQYIRYVTRKKNDKLSEDERQALLLAHDEQMHAIDVFKDQYREQLGAVTTPFYVAQSGKDRLVDPEGVHHVVHSLCQAPLTLHLFPSNHHVITVDRDRTHFEQSVLQFLAMHAPTSEKESL